MRYLIAYDVSDDRVRARLAAMLSVWGDRLQRSVFECTLDASELASIVDSAAGLLDPMRDSLHVVPICATCDGGRHVVGQAYRPDDEVCWVV